MSSEASPQSNPSILERILAYATVVIIGVALLSFFVTLVVGMIDGSTLADGLWPFVYGFSLIGLPVGFVLLIALLLVSQSRRRAEFTRNARKR